MCVYVCVSLVNQIPIPQRWVYFITSTCGIHPALWNRGLAYETNVCVCVCVCVRERERERERESLCVYTSVWERRACMAQWLIKVMGSLVILNLTEPDP